MNHGADKADTDRCRSPRQAAASCSSCPARRSPAAADSASTPTSCTRSPARSPPSSATATQIAVVIGGGNFFRGAELQQRGMDRARSDYMGMLGTVMNCLALQDFLEKEGIDTRVQTAITMGQVAEPYIPLRADPAPGEGPGRHLRRRHGHAVLLHRHHRRPARPGDRRRGVLMGKNGVDGVYDSDPKHEPGRGQVRRARVRRGHHPRSEGRRRHRDHPVPGQQAADPRLRTARRGQHRARREG